MNYVNGFLFRRDGDEVALIEKKNPEWQRGRLNGVGGKIEENETPHQAMQREFKEETGADVEEWEMFATLNHSGHVIYFFVAHGHRHLRSITEEEVNWYFVEDLNEHPLTNKIIDNLRWLIPLALDPDKLTVTIHDQTALREKS